MLKLIAILVVLLPALAAGQGSTSPYDSLYQRMADAYTAKDYNASIAFLLKMIEAPAGARWRAENEYNVACCYALTSKFDEALLHLGLAIDAGYTDGAHIERDGDFTALKRNDPSAFAALVGKARRIFEARRLSESPIAVVAFENYAGPADLARYAWDDYRDPKMDSLRRKYNLDGIAGTGIELDRMKRILDWSARRFEHSGSNVCRGGDALSILAEAERGATFSCTDYARLTANCLIALGYPARVIGLTKFGCAFGSPEAHICAEVWSNDLQKWIVFDGQNDAWWEEAGTPLSALECRDLLLEGRDSAVSFVGQREGWNYGGMKSTWEPYFYHVSVGNSHTFFAPSPKAARRSYELYRPGMIPELYARGVPDSPVLSSDEEEAYPELNRTSIRLMHVDEGRRSDTLLVRLTHTMPWFKTFRVRFNGGAWKESGAEFAWHLGPATNEIEAEAVNEAGIVGKPSRIVVRNNIGIN